jgi:hypothetical protein
MSREKRERRNGILVTETIFVAGLAALTLLNAGSFALAQNDPQAARPADVQSTIEAPIGHVQPTLRDLPPGVAETETKRTKAQKEFDKKLQICRNC